MEYKTHIFGAVIWSLVERMLYGCFEQKTGLIIDMNQKQLLAFFSILCISRFLESKNQKKTTWEGIPPILNLTPGWKTSGP